MPRLVGPIDARLEQQGKICAALEERRPLGIPFVQGIAERDIVWQELLLDEGELVDGLAARVDTGGLLARHAGPIRVNTW